MEPAIAPIVAAVLCTKPSDGTSDEPPGVELIGAHMLPLYPSELNADWKRSTQIEEGPPRVRKDPWKAALCIAGDEQVQDIGTAHEHNALR